MYLFGLNLELSIKHSKQLDTAWFNGKYLKKPKQKKSEGRDLREARISFKCIFET